MIHSTILEVTSAIVFSNSLLFLLASLIAIPKMTAQDKILI